MKRLITAAMILTFAVPVWAQHREGDPITFQVTYISRARLIEVFKGDAVKQGDFKPFTAETKGEDIAAIKDLDFVTFDKAQFAALGTPNEDRPRLTEHLRGFALEVKEHCHLQISRGEECTVHGKRTLRF